jgi:hypothetical protein
LPQWQHALVDTDGDYKPDHWRAFYLANPAVPVDFDDIHDAVAAVAIGGKVVIHEGQWELESSLLISKSMTLCNVGDVSLQLSSRRNDKPLIWLEQPKGLGQDEDIQVVIR